MTCGLHPSWLHDAADCPFCAPARELQRLAGQEAPVDVLRRVNRLISRAKELGVAGEQADVMLALDQITTALEAGAWAYGKLSDDNRAIREARALSAEFEMLRTWAKSRVPSYPFDRNGDCLVCDEQFTHAPTCPYATAG